MFDDVTMLHESLRSHGDSGLGAADEDAVALLHKTVDEIFEEEEQLLNLHMSTIQESAELLTSEGKVRELGTMGGGKARALRSLLTEQPH